MALSSTTGRTRDRQSQNVCGMSGEETVPKRSWFDRRINVRSIRIAFGADMREIALLWLVFGILDLFVADRLTIRWFAGNFLLAIVLWGIGAYIEMRES
jgi:hypothetical protein